MEKEEFSDKKINELLQKSNSSEPFKVPDGYFEGLSEKVMDSIQALPDLNKQAAVQPFTVPGNYFEDLSLNVMDRLKSDTDSFWKRLLRPARLVPASLMIVLILSGYFFFSQLHTYSVNEFSLQVEEVSDSPYIQSMSDDDMMEFLVSQDEDNSTNELDQYLIDNDIELSQLENSL